MMDGQLATLHFVFYLSSGIQCMLSLAYKTSASHSSPILSKVLQHSYCITHALHEQLFLAVSKSGTGTRGCKMWAVGP